ncbi:MAG: hypothetical protein HY303_07845 [Candidatus Wallbacteria bacterium]|nr:hypothetical protein [Candidatus Wallbacteria bacterium]
MSVSMDLEDPTAVALAVAEALEAAGLRHALYGGLALAAYGEARETRDADFCVMEVSTAQAAAALRAKEFELQIAFEGLIFGGVSVDRLTLLPGLNDSGSNTVDFVSPLSRRFAACVLERALRGPLRDRLLTLVSPEDFILLKVLSTRDRDLTDAASVVARLDDRLDWELLTDECNRLAAEVPGHDVAARFARVRELATNARGP